MPPLCFLDVTPTSAQCPSNCMSPVLVSQLVALQKDAQHLLISEDTMDPGSHSQAFPEAVS